MHCSHRISGYIFIMHLPKFYTLPPTHVGNRGGFDKNSMSQHYFITQLVHRLFGKCWSYFSIAIYKKLRSFFVNNDRGSTNSSITGLNQPQPSTVYTLPRDTEYLQLLQVDQKAMHLIYLFRTQHVRLSNFKYSLSGQNLQVKMVYTQFMCRFSESSKSIDFYYACTNGTP